MVTLQGMFTFLYHSLFLIIQTTVRDAVLSQHITVGI